DNRIAALRLLTGDEYTYSLFRRDWRSKSDLWNRAIVTLTPEWNERASRGDGLSQFILLDRGGYSFYRRSEYVAAMKSGSLNACVLLTKMTHENHYTPLECLEYCKLPLDKGLASANTA